MAAVYAPRSPTTGVLYEVLVHGFARVRCGDCAFGRLVPFSCKGRAFCPSCGGRRTAERAAHLVDHVLPPDIPVRQWVLSVPHRLRYRLVLDGVSVCGLDGVLSFHPAAPPTHEDVRRWLERLGLLVGVTVNDEAPDALADERSDRTAAWGLG